ncbi:MAG: alpha/beta fold hydrolase [Acidimicrobiia bacterium]
MRLPTGFERFRRPQVFEPDAPPRQRRTLTSESPEIHYFFTSDGVQLCLTRFRGGSKGPVVLCHGLGVSSAIFTVDTIDTNLVEFLAGHGYDLWLLDFRASIELPSASIQTNADTIAAIDYPEAVARVRHLTGAPSVQMVVHCYGSTVFFMSMLSGALSGVRSAVASQATPHIEAAMVLRGKLEMRLPEILDVLHVETLNAYTDSHGGWLGRLYDRALQLYPLEHEERCPSATCHRISFMYSLLYEHDQLSSATHDILHELFGVATVTTLKHLGKMVRAGHLVDFEGRDVYMPHVERLAIPLQIIHGAENACFHPVGSEKTYGWLRAHNDPTLYSLVRVPRFGHIDCIFGERAAALVFPHILEHLERTL